MPDLEKLGWEAPEEGKPEPKIKVRSTTGFRIGGELVYTISTVRMAQNMTILTHRSRTRGLATAPAFRAKNW